MSATITIALNDAEEAKLEALAKFRQRSTVQCIRDFIAACQPGGTGWTHPGLVKPFGKDEEKSK